MSDELRIHVNRSAATPDPDHREREEPRWCFKERKRVGGEHVLMVEPEGSYYDNWWRYRCDGCGEDHRRFPSA